MEKNFRTFMIYVVLVLVTFLLMHLFVFPFSPFREYLLTYNILFLVSNLFFLRASFSEPGKVLPQRDVRFDKLVEKFDPQGLCPNCETVFTEDSRHCYICQRCFHKFDHHCQWINNCVGRDNHVVFYLYICSFLAYMLFLWQLFLSNFDVELAQEDLNRPYNVLGFNCSPGVTTSH